MSMRTDPKMRIWSALDCSTASIDDPSHAGGCDDDGDDDDGSGNGHIACVDDEMTARIAGAAMGTALLLLLPSPPAPRIVCACVLYWRRQGDKNSRCRDQ